MALGVNLGLVNAVTSVAGTEGQVLVNGNFIPVAGGAVVISLAGSMTGATGFYAVLTGMSGYLETQIHSAAGVLSLNSVTGILTIGGTNGNLISVSGLTIWVSGNSGYNAATYAVKTNVADSVFSSVTGNFSITPPTMRYMWTGGAGTQWTGSLPSPATYINNMVRVKNIATGATLVLSGSVDYQGNYSLAATSAAALLSDGSSWILV